MTGTSFINRSQTEVFGEAFRITFIEDCLKEGNRDLTKSFLSISGAPLLAPSASDRGSLSRRRRAGPRSLVAPFWRPEPLAGCSWAPAKLRRLWYVARYLQHYWRAFHMWNGRGCSGFWQFRPYVQPDVRQGSAWRGLSRVCPLTHSGTSFSTVVSQSLIFV